MISESESLSVAVSYIRESGLDEIHELIWNRRARFIVGLGHAITECGALERLIALSQTGHVQAAAYCSNKSIEEPGYHPKVFIGIRGDEVTVLLGSSNLSRPAMSTNVEANLLLKGRRDEPEIMKILAFFDGLWSNSNCIPLSKAILDKYAEMCMLRKRATEGLDDRMNAIYHEMSELGGMAIKDRANFWIVAVDNFDKASMQRVGLYGVDASEERFHGGSFRGVKKGDVFILHNLGGRRKLKGCDVGIVKVLDKPYFKDVPTPEWRNPERASSPYYGNYPWRVPISLAEEDVFETPVKSQEWLNELSIRGMHLRAVNTHIAGALYRGKTIIPLTDEEAAVILGVIGRRNPAVLKYVEAINE